MQDDTLLKKQIAEISSKIAFHKAMINDSQKQLKKWEF